jgi:hypothetical protein
VTQQTTQLTFSAQKPTKMKLLPRASVLSHYSTSKLITPREFGPENAQSQPIIRTDGGRHMRPCQGTGATRSYAH